MVKNRKAAFIFSLVMLLPLMLSAQDEGASADQPEKAVSRETINAGLEKIEKDIAFLQERHAEIKDLPLRLEALRKKAEGLAAFTDEKELAAQRQIVMLMTEKLEMELNSKTSLVRRMELLYIMMFTFGVAFIVGMVAYAVYMYAKRRK